MSWQVIIHPKVENWLIALPEEDYLRTMVALEILEELGPGLGRPFVDTLKGSKFKNLKELRPRGNFLRLIFIFILKEKPSSWLLEIKKISGVTGIELKLR